MALTGRSIMRKRRGQKPEGVAQDVGRADHIARRYAVDREQLRQLEKDVQMSAPDIPQGARPTRSVSEAIGALGFTRDQRAVAQKIATKIISGETKSMFDMSKQGVTAGMNRYQISELMRRALEVKDRNRVSKSSPLRKEDNWGAAKDLKPPKGFTDFGSKISGGKRKPDPHGGYQYWYPKTGLADKPHSDEHAHHQEHHENSTPSPEVREAYKKLLTTAHKANFKINGNPPTSKTKLSQVEKHQATLDKSIAEHAKNTAETEDDESESPTEISNDVTDDLEDDEDDIEDAETEEYSIEGDEWGTDNAATDKDEVVQLQAQVAELTEALAQVREQAQEEFAEVYKQLQAQAQLVHNQPNQQRVQTLADKIKGLLLLLVGTVAGAAMGGPVGAVIGATMASQHNKIKRQQKQMFGKSEAAVLKKGIYYDKRTDRLVIVRQDSLTKGGPFIGPRGGLWADAKHTIPWKKPTPQVHESEKYIQQPDTPSASRMRQVAMYQDGEVSGHIAASTMPRTGKPAMMVMALDVDSGHPLVGRTWLPNATEASARKWLAAKLGPEDDESNTGKSPINKSVTSQLQHDQKLRAQQPKAKNGHRDDLVVGQRLTIRKSHIVSDKPTFIEVQPNGEFQWGNDIYKNGRRLLKAVTNNPKHHLTIRRYFKLENQQ